MRKSVPGSGSSGNPVSGRAVPGLVVLLGVVSLLTDVSSEMIYPLLPLFLTSVLNTGPVALGIVEGVAEATASLLKVASGLRTDRTGRRVPLVVGGYALASVARPLIGLAQLWPHVLLLRFADRIGKGLRTSPRDALIADVTRADQRGTAFGVQIALDSGGAMLGPLIAAALLGGLGLGLRSVFLLAAVPAALAMAVLLLGLREPKQEAAAGASAPPAPGLRAGWRELSPAYKRFLAALFLFYLGASSDAFLLLRVGGAGVAAGGVALLWAAFNAVKALSSLAGGRLTDRCGPRAMLLAGWALYAVVYLAFALLQGTAALVAVFLVYGLYYGLTQAAERAWVARLVPAHLRGTGFGYFHSVIGLTALPASLLFGELLQHVGVEAAFATGAALATAGLLVLLRVPRPAAGTQ